MSTQGKHAAAKEAIELFASIITEKIRENGKVIIGVGTGSTILILMEKLKTFLALQGYEPHQLIGIPTSTQSSELIIDCGMTLGSLLQYPTIDFGFDGADEVDSTGHYLIKGGGAAHFQEKLVAAACDRLFILVDESKIGKHPEELGLIVSWFHICCLYFIIPNFSGNLFLSQYFQKHFN